MGTFVCWEKGKKKKKETCQCIKHLLLQQLQVHHQAALSGGDVTALTVGTDKIHCVSRWAADWMSEYEPWRSADVTWFGPNACGRRFHLLTGIRCAEGVVFLLYLYIYIYQKSRGCIAINHINRDSRRLIRGKKSTLSHTLRESVFWFNGLAEHASVVTSDVKRHRAHGFLRHMTPARAPSNSLGMGINLNGTWNHKWFQQRTQSWKLTAGKSCCDALRRLI